MVRWMDGTELTPEWSKLDDEFNEWKALLPELLELFPEMSNPMPKDSSLKESSLDDNIKLNGESPVVLLSWLLLLLLVLADPELPLPDGDP